MENKLETAAIVELFGHTRIAGILSEQVIAGASMVRVEVPETTQQPAFTRFLNPTAIYAINPVTEEIMKGAAESLQAKPINSYDVAPIFKKMMEEGKLIPAPASRVPEELEEEEFGIGD